MRANTIAVRVNDKNTAPTKPPKAPPRPPVNAVPPMSAAAIASKFEFVSVPVVATADPETHLAIVATGLDEWLGLCRVIGRPDWAQDASLATPAGRNERADEIEAALAGWAHTRPAQDAADVLQAAGVPAAPVIPSDGLTDEPHMAAAGTWMRIERRHVGRHLMAAPPYRIDGERPTITRPAPLLGEHTAEVRGALQQA